MDPSRSGLIPSLWTKKRPGYRDYAEWALDAGMFLFKRGDEYIANTGQTFRSFLREGFQGHRATQRDWKLHLSTLFPGGADQDHARGARLRFAIHRSGVRDLRLLRRFALRPAERSIEPRSLRRALSYDEVTAARPALWCGTASRQVSPGGRRGSSPSACSRSRAVAFCAVRASTPSGKDERIHLVRLSALTERRSLAGGRAYRGPGSERAELQGRRSGARSTVTRGARSALEEVAEARAAEAAQDHEEEHQAHIRKRKPDSERRDRAEPDAERAVTRARGRRSNPGARA